MERDLVVEYKDRNESDDEFDEVYQKILIVLSLISAIKKVFLTTYIVWHEEEKI